MQASGIQRFQTTGVNSFVARKLPVAPEKSIEAVPKDSLQSGTPAAPPTVPPKFLSAIKALRQTSPPATTGPDVNPTAPPASAPQTPSAAPSLQELREKLYAVHVTDFLPSGGEMVAGAVMEGKGTEKTPMSFRPTLHFSLGQMVAEHGRYSWDAKKFGVVLPLKSLEPQLANVAPHDTFIVGNLKLPPEAVVFVPEGTSTEGLPKEIQVRHYKGKLREAIDQHIKERDGWQVKMSGVTTDDPARIGERDINTPEFFGSLLKSDPKVSFGSHIGSEVGEAFRFGSIEQAMVQFGRSFNEYGYPLNNSEAKFYRAFVKHNVDRLPKFEHPASRKAVEGKLAILNDQLKVVDVDLEFRKKGYSLSRTSETTQRLATSMSILGPLTVPLLKSQLNRAEEGKVSIPAMVEALSSLPPSELREFEKNNPELFKDVDVGALHARYAVNRWIQQRGDKESLESILMEGMQSAKEPLKLLEELTPSLKKGSYREELALSILRRPVVQMNLQKEEGMTFSLGGPHTLSEAIQAHPQAKLGSLEWAPTAPSGKEKEAALLKKMGRDYIPDPADHSSFESCVDRADTIGFYQRSFDRDLKDLDRPTNSVVPLENLSPGSRLGLLEQIRRDGVKGRELPADTWNSPLPFKAVLEQFLAS